MPLLEFCLGVKNTCEKGRYVGMNGCRHDGCLAIISEFYSALQDECSYVSLRDIERFMMVYRWFEGLNQELSEYMQWNERVRNKFIP